MPRIGIVLLALATAVSTVHARPRQAHSDRRTVAEASSFEATSTYEETLEFLRSLCAGAPELRLRFFGTSAQGRPMPVVIASGQGNFTPRAAEAAAAAIVMIQNGIHAGEIDGKDASLMILRDFAAGKRRELLEAMTLLVIPIYNVDGHERISPHNRPNQNGPRRGMGFRTTSDGHDLNRDHLKLETPEARALIGLFNKWRPHLHVDNHVTDGSEHDWVLTYSWAEAPQIAPSIDSWLASRMPRVLRATREAGHRIGPYVSLLDGNDPSRGFSSYIGLPRYATGYYPLRNRPSLLVENHSYKPYRQRVLANRDFMLALLGEVARDPRSLIEAVAAAQSRTVELGRPQAPPSQAVLKYESVDRGDTVRFPAYAWTTETSRAMGTPILRYERGRVREVEVPWIHRSSPSVTVERPRGYLVLPGWPVIERRLRDHGLRVERISRPLDLQVETQRLRARPRAESRAGSYQGLTRIEPEIEREVERRTLPHGTLWIPADQPDFEVAVQLLEAEAPDSLVSWGMLSIVMERKEYIDPRVLEGLVAEMLEDPEIASAWQLALAYDEFAANPWARWEWWYRRTEYWDDTVGLSPVMRLLTPPVFETESWRAPDSER